MIVVLLISLYTSRVILHSLGIEDFGIYNVVGGFVAMFSFLNTSMNNAIQRFYNYEWGRNGATGMQNVYKTALCIQVLIALLVLIATETIGLWYMYKKMVIPADRFTAALWIFQFSIISLLLLILQIPYSAAIMAHEDMNYYAIINVLDAFLKLCVALSIPLFKGDSLILYGFLILLISVTNWFLYFIYSKIRYRELSIRLNTDKLLFKQMLSFSGWNLFGSFSRIAKEQGLNLLLNLFFGPIVNAARSVAYQVSAGVQGFVTNITIAARPQLTQSYAQGNIHRTISIMFSVSKLCYLSLFIMALPVIIETGFILKIWLGDKIPPNTDIFIIVVIITSLIHVFNPPTSFVVHATGKMKKYQVVCSLINISVIPVSYIVLLLGAPPVSVFIIGCVFTFIGQSVAILILKQLISFSIRKYLLKVILPVLLITLVVSVFALIPRVLMEEGWNRLLCAISISLFFTSLLSYQIGLTKQEKRVIHSLIRSKLNNN